MSGGTSEVIRDNSPLVECLHKGVSGTSIFKNKAYKFDTFVKAGVYAENTTKSYYGVVASISSDGHEITIDWVVGGDGIPLTFGDEAVEVGGESASFGEYSAWDYGDTLKIYCTSTRGRIISTVWCDLSRGWKTKQKDLIEGWREEDVDLNRDGEKVWGPNQPEGYR